jgi:hypothetical protein
MNRYIVEISALLYVETINDPDTLANNLVSQLEELAASSEHLLDYELTPHPLPGNEDNEPPDGRDKVNAA